MEAVASGMVTQFTSMISTLTDSLADIAPLAIPIIGIGLVVVIGIKLFKKIANKA